MGATANPTLTAVTVFLVCTLAMLNFTLVWALANRRPVRPRPHMIGRSAAPYLYTPTRLQDGRTLTRDAALARQAVRPGGADPR